MEKREREEKRGERSEDGERQEGRGDWKREGARVRVVTMEGTQARKARHDMVA
jgi:hypothetical protein